MQRKYSGDLGSGGKAAVKGWVIGGSHHLAYMCDFTIAAETARFGQNGPRVSSPADGYIVAYLTKVVGTKKAREIWMLCRKYTAQQALEWGLINYLYQTKKALFEGAEKLAQDIIKSAPLPVGAFKKIIKRGEGVDLMTHLDMEASLQSIMIRTEDFQEGVNALVEGRNPQRKRK